MTMAAQVTGELFTDDQLEQKIDAAYLRMATARTPKARRLAFEEMQGLIAQRSPKQILKMEQKQGLR